MREEGRLQSSQLRQLLRRDAPKESDQDGLLATDTGSISSAIAPNLARIRAVERKHGLPRDLSLVAGADIRLTNRADGAATDAAYCEDDNRVGLAANLAGRWAVVRGIAMRFPADVLVLEPALPWGDGAGVLDRMRSDPDVPTTPVVVVTSGCDLEQLRQILRFPLYDLAVKPHSPEQLAIKIRWVTGAALKLGNVGWPRPR